MAISEEGIMGDLHFVHIPNIEHNHVLFVIKKKIWKIRKLLNDEEYIS